MNAPAPVVRGYVDAGWGQVHYRSAGESGPGLVLFHESPQSSWVFDRVLPLLGTRLRVYAFDTPGYGASTPPPRDAFEIPDYAAALLTAVDAVGLDTFAVGGVHTGASIAIAMAAEFAPERVSCLALSGVPTFSAEERAEWLASWSPPLELAADGSHLQWAWDRYVRIWGEDSGPDMLTRAVVGLMQIGERYEWAYNAAFRYDPDEALRSLDVPVLLVNADNDLLAPQDPRALSLLKHGRLDVVPGLRGQIAWRVPELFASSVGDFVLDAAGANTDEGVRR